MKQSFYRRFKQSVSAVLAAAMSLSVFPSVPAAAENGSASVIDKTTYTYDDYYVEYYVTDAWSGSQNVELTVYNTGEDSILNWALKYDAQGAVSNLWNAGIYEQNDSEYVIRNVDWNFEIAPNQCVMYGYRLTGDDLSLPESFELYSKRVDVTENYDVTYNITNEWDTGVQGEIVITNYAAAPLEAWTLSFDSNFAVIDLWNGRVLENNGTSYTIAAEVWTNPVQPNSSMTIGFTGTKEASVEAVLSNFRLTQVVIGESNGTATPVDPPIEDEKIEITANAAYDEENGNVTISWDSNKQEGMFDILMSSDGENFASVGTVTGVSEYVYTPDNDFETLYFKVVQTVDEQSAESNVVSVTNTKSSEDITISANGVYDEESGDITISWETNTDNGSFEIFMSEDGEEFISIGTVKGVSEYVYTPATDFEEIYFKVVQTAGNKSAESNVVTVNNSIVLAVITSANYDEESGNIKVSWITSFNKGTYEILVSEDNDNFTSIGTVENAKEFIYTPDGEFDVLYFRVKQTVGKLTAESKSTSVYYPIDWEDDTDTDNDGLIDIIEKYYFGTDPTNSDTDGDGLPDGYEVYTLETDPVKADSDDNGINDGDEDFDNDGLSNFREYELGTEPNNADSDNDGLTDSDEVNIYNTDPLKFDTDGDRVSDSDEIALGLNPTNASTDGTSDTERTFVQHIGVDSKILQDVNSSENVFKVSVDITAAGVAENNLYSKKSSYVNAMNSSAVIGIAPEFTYAYGLKVEDVVINFDLDSSVVANTNGKYVSISDEFVGIKRLNIFKYFEDTNMLLPIETFHDTENNRVYTHVDELGTYCLMDMEIWLDSLGMDLNDETFENNNARRSRAVSVTDEYAISTLSDSSALSANESIDIVFLLYVRPSYTSFVKEELLNAVNEIYNKASDVRIYFLVNDGRTVEPYRVGTRTYAESRDEAVSIVNRFNFTNDTSGALYRGLTEANNIALRDESQKHLFLIDAVLYPPTGTSYECLDELKAKGVTFGVICDIVNDNKSQYTVLSSGNIKSNVIVFSDFIINQIQFPEKAERKLIITSSGLTPLPENFNNISSTMSTDYDKDGIKDIDEIDIKYVTIESDGSISYPNFPEMQKKYEGIFYVEQGLKRVESDLDQTLHNFMRDVYVMPIKSDPTDPDGDGDKVVDGVDLRPLAYIPNFVNLDLDKDTISWYYDIRMDIIPHEDEHGNVIGANNRENTVTKYYYDEYIAPRYGNRTYFEWAQETYGISDKEIYLQKSYDQIVLGNAYEGDITILGTAGSIIVGFSPFGVVCDIRDLVIDLEQFDPDKGFAQGTEWYLNAIPDVLGILPLSGVINKVAGKALDSLSKADASKIVNYAISEAVDESGHLVKNTDEIVEAITDEAEEILKHTDYKKTDDIFEAVGQTSSEQSANAAKNALRKESEAIEEARMWRRTSYEVLDSTDEVLDAATDDIYRLGKNGRLELKPNITYKTASGQIYKTGSKGEIISVSGSISKAKGTRNPYAQKVAGREARLKSDDGGHLIATIFGGDGGLANLVPMDGHLNKSPWKIMENKLAKILDMEHVTDLQISIDIDYADTLRPTKFNVTVTAFFDNGPSETGVASFLNTAEETFKNFDGFEILEDI